MTSGFYNAIIGAAVATAGGAFEGLLPPAAGPAEQGRLVSRGNVQSMVTTAAITDIVPDSPDLALGRGWYAAENFAGTRFRWASNDAEILVVALLPVRHTLVFSVEPGPGVGLKPFTLKVNEGAKEIAGVEVRGKQVVRVDLPPAGPKVYRVILHVDGGGRTIANDARVLNFRVFDISVEHGSPDVLPAEMELGTGWYPLERDAGSAFRWVSNDAKVVLSNPDGSAYIDLDLQSGPGLGNAPFILHVLQNVKGELKPVSDVQVNGHERVNVSVPKGDRVELILRVDATGRKTPGDPRELNFRAFEYAGAV